MDSSIVRVCQTNIPEFQKNSPDRRKALANSRLGLFGEGLHLVQTVPAHGLVYLYVTVAGRRTGRLYADGHQCLVRGGELDRLFHDVPESRFIENEVVRRRDYHGGVRGGGLQPESGVGDAGCGVAAERFGQYLLRCDFRQLFEYEVAVGAVRDDEKVFCRDELREPFEGAPDEGFPRS